MRPGNADVMNHRHSNAHPIERLSGFFRNWQITRTRCDDGHTAQRGRRGAPLLRVNAERSSDCIVSGCGEQFPQAKRLFPVNSSRHHTLPALQ
jgi:hypothetical protein